MENHESAALCIERLNGVSLKGKQISVRWASRNKKLFITNIGRSVHINDILSLCEAYGSVCPERSSLNKADSGNIYAVVEFDRREAAETARLALNGSVLHLNGEETTVFANWEQSLSYRTNQSPESHPSPFPYYSVHISFRATAVISSIFFLTTTHRL
jgi:RNA recognition motif-containing protein